MAGLGPTGFDKKTQDDCLQEMKTDLWSSVSKGLNLATPTPMGQILTRLSVREGLIWDAIEAVHAARDPNQASGSSLRAVSQTTGTLSQSATKTVVPGCTLNLASGFHADPATMVACLDTDPTALFTNANAVDNPGGSTADITGVEFIAINPGAQPALAGHLNTISQTLSGWNSINNPTDGEAGLADDDDVSLRLRRESELQTSGSSTADAIKSDILKFLQSNITSCKVLVNEGDVVDADGLPPHSFEVIARGQSEDVNASIALAKQILASKDGGDRAHGVNSEVVVDANGNSHVIGFTWVADENVYVVVNVSIIADEYPADGDAEIKNAILALAFDPGQHVVAGRLNAACFSIPGVDDVPSLYIGTSPSPASSAAIAIDVRSQAKFDSSRIVINHV